MTRPDDPRPAFRSFTWTGVFIFACILLVGTHGSTTIVFVTAEEVTHAVHLREKSFVQALNIASTFQRAADRIRDARIAATKPNGEYRRQLRRLDGTPQICEEKLASLMKELDQPSYLFVQMADECMMVRYDGGNKYMLKSKHFHDTTTMFSDRPFKIEEAMSTANFFGQFDEMFEIGGKPNAAFTFVQDNESADILVSVAIKAVSKGSVNTYLYKLEQSEEQEAILPLSSFFEEGEEDGDGEANGKVVLDHCSIFIDSYQRRRIIPCSPEQAGLGKECVNDEDCCSGICSANEGKRRCSQRAGFPCPGDKPNSKDALCSSGSCDQDTMCADL